MFLHNWSDMMEAAGKNSLLRPRCFSTILGSSKALQWVLIAPHRGDWWIPVRITPAKVRLFPTVCNSCPELREGQKNLHILQITDDRICPIRRGSKFKYIIFYIYFFMADGSLKFGDLSTVRTVRNQLNLLSFPKKVDSISTLKINTSISVRNQLTLLTA